LTNAYPRESVEFQPVRVTRDGLLVTTGLEFSIVPDGERPTVWTPSALVNNQTGVIVQGLQRGTYRIFARVANPQEIPVIDCGYFYVT
jgi:hypothetical protein